MSIREEIHLAAEQLGFTLQDDRAEGLVDGRRVTFSLEWSSRQDQIFVRGWLDPPLDLGLRMSRRAFASIAYEDVMTGNTDLDAEFTLRADAAARSFDLFTTSFCEHLAALHRASFDLTLSDEGCSLSEPYGVGVDAAWLVRAAREAAKTVAMIEALRERIRPAIPLMKLADGLSSLAYARRWQLRTTPFAVRGELEGRVIALSSSRVRSGHHVCHLDVTFDAPLGLALAIERAGLFTAVATMLGRQDIVVGQADFDRRFLVRANEADVDRVKRIFGAAVCDSLLRVDSEAGPVRVTDHGIRVDPIAADVTPEVITRAIDAVHEARLAIERAWIHGLGGGPYR